MFFSDVDSVHRNGAKAIAARSVRAAYPAAFLATTRRRNARLLDWLAEVIVDPLRQQPELQERHHDDHDEYHPRISRCIAVVEVSEGLAVEVERVRVGGVTRSALRHQIDAVEV